MPRVDPPTSSALPRIAVVALLVALVGAIAYIVHLQGRVAPSADQRAAAPAAARSPAPAQAAAPAAGAPVVNEAAVAAVLTAEQQRAMRDTLAAAPGADRKAWFQVQANNQGTAVVQAALQRVFETAGWTTETVRAPYRLKSGIFILAGDEQPPATVESVNARVPGCRNRRAVPDRLSRVLHRSQAEQSQLGRSGVGERTVLRHRHWLAADAETRELVR